MSNEKTRVSDCGSVKIPTSQPGSGSASRSPTVPPAVRTAALSSPSMGIAHAKRPGSFQPSSAANSSARAVELVPVERLRPHLAHEHPVVEPEEHDEPEGGGDDEP